MVLISPAHLISCDCSKASSHHLCIHSIHIPIFTTISLLTSLLSTPLFIPFPQMKDLSFFLAKNTLASKMRKGFKNFCNGDGSTSTLNQTRNQQMSCMATPSIEGSPYIQGNSLTGHAPTLEEMILQLELEEEAARKAKVTEYRRMSCVSNSDVLRSARNALNQYPRFSLDGKDAMYRSSFKNFAPVIGGYEGGRKSVCCGTGLTGRILGGGYSLDIERNLNLPKTLGGKRVMWCKPGVVPKLMGLEAMPVPVNRKVSRGTAGCTAKKQNLRRAEKQEKEKRRFTSGVNGCREISEITSSYSPTTDYSMMKPMSPIKHPKPKGKDLVMHERRFCSQHI